MVFRNVDGLHGVTSQRVVLFMDHRRLYEYLGVELAIVLEHTSM
jgi:hypothetical protein